MRGSKVLVIWPPVVGLLSEACAVAVAGVLRVPPSPLAGR